MNRLLHLIVLTTVLKICACETMNETSLLSDRLNFPIVSLSYPRKSESSAKASVESGVIQKEDPTDVEEFPVNEGQIFEGARGGGFPSYDYPSGFNPLNPANPGNPFVPASGGNLDAFTARRALDLELIPGSKIKFMDTVTKLGIGWNNETSEFICHSPGIFFFTFSSCGEQFRHFRVTLRYNGIGIVSAFGDLNGYQMASNGAVLRLFQGDVVYLTLDEGGIFEVSTFTGRAYNTFSGFRIL